MNVRLDQRLGMGSGRSRKPVAKNSESEGASSTLSLSLSQLQNFLFFTSSQFSPITRRDTPYSPSNLASPFIPADTSIYTNTQHRDCDCDHDRTSPPTRISPKLQYLSSLLNYKRRHNYTAQWVNADTGWTTPEIHARGSHCQISAEPFVWEYVLFNHRTTYTGVRTNTFLRRRSEAQYGTASKVSETRLTVRDG